MHDHDQLWASQKLSSDSVEALRLLYFTDEKQGIHEHPKHGIIYLVVHGEKIFKNFPAEFRLVFCMLLLIKSVINDCILLHISLMKAGLPSNLNEIMCPRDTNRTVTFTYIRDVQLMNFAVVHINSLILKTGDK